MVKKIETGKGKAEKARAAARRAREKVNSEGEAKFLADKIKVIEDKNKVRTLEPMEVEPVPEPEPKPEPEPESETKSKEPLKEKAARVRAAARKVRKELKLVEPLEPEPELELESIPESLSEAEYKSIDVSEFNHTVFKTAEGAFYAVSQRVIGLGYTPTEGVVIATEDERHNFWRDIKERASNVVLTKDREAVIEDLKKRGPFTAPLPTDQN